MQMYNGQHLKSTQVPTDVTTQLQMAHRARPKNTVTTIAVYYLLAETILYIAPLNVRIYI
jgi:hypothetical protein